MARRGALHESPTSHRDDGYRRRLASQRASRRQPCALAADAAHRNIDNIGRQPNSADDSVTSRSDFELPLRITVRRPPSGVEFAVQRGSAELIAPSARDGDALVFDFSVRVDGVTSSGAPRLLGPFTQGPPSARFVYVNAGQSAGQANTRWNRRAKIPLAGITASLIQAAAKSLGVRIETDFAGTGADGGPTCATVKSIVWRVEAR